jgi:hypothetical protein
MVTEDTSLMVQTKIVGAVQTRRLGLVVLASLFCLTCGTAFAGETLTLSESGFATRTFTSAGDSIATPASFTYGQWNLVSSSAFEAGTPAAPDLDLIVQALSTAASPGALTLTFTQTGFTSIPIDLTDAVGGSNNATKSVFSVLYNNTAIPALGYTSSSGGKLPTAFSNTSTIVVAPPSSPYSLTEQVVISSDGKPSHVESFDMELKSTPEPSLYALTGAGIAGVLALAIRRKNRSSV